MQPSKTPFVCVYVLLSAGLYLVVATLAHLSSGRQIAVLGGIAGGIFLGQLAYVAVMGPSKDLVPMRPWRLVLAAALTTAVLEVLMYTGFWWLVVMTSKSIVDIGWAALPIVPLPTMVLLCYWCRGRDRFVVFGRMLTCILVLGAAEGLFSLVAILSYYIWHIWHEDDIWYWFHGDPGVGTAIAMFLILFALAWSVGPLMVWLYYRRLRGADAGVDATRQPEPGPCPSGRTHFHVWALPLLWVSMAGALQYQTWGQRGELAMAPTVAALVRHWLPALLSSLWQKHPYWPSYVPAQIAGGALMLASLGLCLDHLHVRRRWALLYPAGCLAGVVLASSLDVRQIVPGALFFGCLGVFAVAAMLLVGGVGRLVWSAGLSCWILAWPLCLIIAGCSPSAGTIYHSLAFSPDSRLVVYAQTEYAGVYQLGYETPRGYCRYQQTLHWFPVDDPQTTNRCMYARIVRKGEPPASVRWRFSPDSHKVAALDSCCGARIIDLQTGCVRLLESDEPTPATYVDSDLTWSGTNEVRYWIRRPAGAAFTVEVFRQRLDTSPAVQTRVLCEQTMDLGELLWSPNGRWLFLLGSAMDRTISSTSGQLGPCIVDVASESVRRLQLQADHLLGAAWRPNTDTLALLVSKAVASGTVASADMRQTRLLLANINHDTAAIREIPAPVSELSTIQWTSEGLYLLVRTGDGGYMLLEPDSGRMISMTDALYRVTQGIPAGLLVEPLPASGWLRVSVNGSEMALDYVMQRTVPLGLLRRRMGSALEGVSPNGRYVASLSADGSVAIARSPLR